MTITATESRIGVAYGNDTNLYSLESSLEANVHIEFLDVEKENVPANIVQPVRNFLSLTLPPPNSSLQSQVAS